MSYQPPMLAFNRKHKKKHEKYPAMVQPKLDGIRATWQNGRLYSREGVAWSPFVLPHIMNALERVKRVGLDGELYIHGERLQKINSIVSVMRTAAHERYLEAEFHVYDMMTLQPFKERSAILRRCIDQLPDCIKFVETLRCEREETSSQLFRQYRKEGYEGMMIRNETSPYGFLQNCGNKENRWHYLLKYKEWDDMVATITGFNKGKDDSQWENTLGSLQCVTPKGVSFNVSTGISFLERDYIWQNQHEFVGTNVKIKFEVLSEIGRPLKPVIELLEALV